MLLALQRRLGHVQVYVRMKEALHSSSTRFLWMVQGRPGKLTAPLSQGNVVVFHLLPDVWNVFVRPDIVVFQRRQELFSRFTYWLSSTLSWCCRRSAVMSTFKYVCARGQHFENTRLMSGVCISIHHLAPLRRMLVSQDSMFARR